MYNHMWHDSFQVFAIPFQVSMLLIPGLFWTFSKYYVFGFLAWSIHLDCSGISFNCHSQSLRVYYSNARGVADIYESGFMGNSL